MSDWRLSHLYVNPASSCNLSCAHCWVSPARSQHPFETRDRESDEFTPVQFRELLKAASGLGMARLKFTGSEPLLRSDFAELYTSAAECAGSPKLDIETNGTLEPPGLWEALDIHPPGVVSVSLDSVDPLLHDRFRGTPGAWERSRSFLSRLVSTGIMAQVVMSVVDLHTGPVLEMARFCRDIGAASLKVNPVQPMGRGEELVGEPGRTPDLIAFSREIFNLTGPSVLVDMPPAFVPLNRLRSHPGCPVLSLLGVLPDGGISFCGIGFSCPSLLMGNFLRDGLEDIWLSSPVILRLRKDLLEGPEGICRDCIHLGYCRGKCVMQNYAVTGGFREPFQVCAEADVKGLFPSGRRVITHA